MVLERADFGHLIPHGDRMCLLDRIEQWDDRSLTATSDSHRHADHPLRRRDQLHVVNGLEYAAQAMAVHGALRGLDRGGVLAGGLLAAARDLCFHTDRLDTLTHVLRIEVVAEHAQPGSMIDRFVVRAGQTTAIEGTAVVVGHDPAAPTG